MRSLSLLKDSYKGQKIVLVGNGPSLTIDDLNYLMDKNIITYGVNKIFKSYENTKWRPTFYSASDHAILSDIVDSFEQHVPEFTILPESTRGFFKSKPQKDNILFINHVSRSSTLYSREFSYDASQITYGGYTVLFLALQVVYYLGFKDIYLIGVDHNYSSANIKKTSQRSHNGRMVVHESGSNHFHKDYFKPGEIVGDFYPEEVVESFEMANNAFKKEGRSIINCSQKTKLDILPRGNLRKLV